MTETPSGERIDYLYRVSLKAFIQNEQGEVLVVKEAGRTQWDLPGGGVDHGETILDAMKRELKEEVGYEDEFDYAPLFVEDPHVLPDLDIYQLRLVLHVKTENFRFSTGHDSDEIAFISPEVFRDAKYIVGQKIYHYAQLLQTASKE